ncbi:MAG: hypothetical protein ABSB14_10345 [Candidatus Sulfotelmatobacter sp.]|jgi:hypothetical protein
MAAQTDLVKMKKFALLPMSLQPETAASSGVQVVAGFAALSPKKPLTPMGQRQGVFENGRLLDAKL